MSTSETSISKTSNLIQSNPCVQYSEIILQALRTYFHAPNIIFSLKIQSENGGDKVIFNKNLVHRSFHESTIHLVIVLKQIMVIDLSRPRNIICCFQRAQRTSK